MKSFAGLASYLFNVELHWSVVLAMGTVVQEVPQFISLFTGG